MDEAELLAVVERYPFVKDGLLDHRDEVLRIAKRILVMENTPTVIPDLPVDAPAWERAYWRRRAGRS
jgi:hypothetical protein